MILKYQFQSRIHNILIILFIFMIGNVVGQIQEKQNNQTNCIIINELVQKPVRNGEDWIELYNQCDEKQNLRGFQIQDSNPENFFKFGNDAENCTHEIDGFGYLLLIRDANCSFTFGLSQQDELRLFNNFDKVIDGVTWGEGDAPEGKSWARIPDGIGRFRSAFPTPDSKNQEYQILDRTMITDPKNVTIVINEVVAFPKEPETDWVELFNYGTRTIDLADFWLTDERDDKEDRYIFGKQGCEEQAIISPGRFLVIRRDISNCSFRFGLGKSDQISLWLDRNTKIDSTSYGPEYNTSTVPQGVSWGRLPNGPSGGFITCRPSKGKKNEKAIVGDMLVQYIRAGLQDGDC